MVTICELTNTRTKSRTKGKVFRSEEVMKKLLYSCSNGFLSTTVSCTPGERLNLEFKNWENPKLDKNY